MDKLKEISVKLDGKIRSQKFYNANIEDISFKRLIVKNYRQFKITVDEYKNLYSIGINVNSNLSFSINNPDKIFLYNTPKNITGLPNKIYVSDETDKLFENEYLEKFWSSLTIILSGIGLSAHESIIFYNNYIVIFLGAQRDLLPILDSIIDLIGANNDIFSKELKKNISTYNIPDNLRPLIPFLRKYSISDDALREQLEVTINEKEKQKLIDSVQPFFDEIRIYLNSFKDVPLNEEAILIGNLAELVSELKIKDI